MLRDLKLKPRKADLPPRLRWEGELWQWYWRLAEPTPPNGRLRVPRSNWLATIRNHGWCESLAFRLLQVIEEALIDTDKTTPARADD